PLRDQAKKDASRNISKGYGWIHTKLGGQVGCPQEAPDEKRKIFPLPRFPDSTVLHILRFLPADSRARCARVCRQWHHLAWDPRIWRNVFDAAGVDVDRALAVNSQRLSNCGLVTLARHCPELRRLELPSCNGITNQALALVLAFCTSLQHLNVSGKQISTSPSTAHMTQGCHLSLHHLDMSGCTGFTLECLHAIALHCPALSHLYLRRCTAVTDSGLRILASHCPSLREISMCDCPAITDVGIWELAQILRVGLRYLSVAHCIRLTDATLYHLGNYCPGLRYLNVRGLPSLTNIGLAALARGCPRLRSLDVGHCAKLRDAGFEALAAGCPAIRRLGLRGCHHVTSQGLRAIATGCPELRLLSLQGCLIPAEWLNFVRKKCSHCVIEHTNFNAFFGRF
uniref:F-box and leucine rich repeat protein 7 n=1 Tax=Eptatretus burgeri TaxID=7764 RepID=A0A8C4N3Z6_EPTBU